MAVEGTLAAQGGGHAILVALGILAHIEPVGPNLQGAFVQQDAAGPDAGLVQVVVAHGIGLNVHRLVAVGFFRLGQPPKKEEDHQQEQGDE